MEYFNLINGQQVPCLCYGPGMLTRGLTSPKTFVEKIKYRVTYKKQESLYYKAIVSAIKNGFRFIDYSATYSREDLIGKAIRESQLSRSEFILTTRIDNKAQFQGTVRDTFFRSLERYGTDYIDLLMFHWPVTEKYVNTWTEMIRLKEEGFCRNLGVSNCHSHHIDLLIKATGVIPFINQVEVHPLFTQKGLADYCKNKSIVIEAYTPLARMDERMTRLPLMKSLSKKYNKTITQLILRWHVQNGIIPVFRSMNSERQKENMAIFDFTISENDMRAIDSININSRLRYDPDNCDFTIL